jgi:hypothetical protein
MKRVRYCDGCRFQLRETYTEKTGIYGYTCNKHPFISLQPDGLLTILAGYAWDGASRPAINTKSFIRGSLVHDAFYDLMRHGYLPLMCQPLADQELRRICVEDGMWKVRAWWVFTAVREFGRSSAHRQKEQILTAP